MTDLRARAELTRLARTLNTGTAQLPGLEAVPAADLRELRERVETTLFERYAQSFRGLAAVAKIAPTALAAKLATAAFGPVLTAQVAGSVEPKTAVAVAAKLPVDFLTDLSLHLDPSRTRRILPLLDIEIVVAVAKELVGRGDAMTMGLYIDFLPEQALTAVVDTVTDDAALVQAVYFAHDLHKLESVIRALPEHRQRAIVHTALTGPAESCLAALSLLSRLDDRLTSTLLDLAAAESDEVLTAFIETAITEHLRPQLRAALDNLSETGRARFAELPAYAALERR